MLIIPAIDLIEGRCVRLREGRLSSEEVYSQEPVAVAELWELKGAKRLHIVDLDGAFEGKPQNLKVVKKIVQKIKIPIQFGGGIRNFKTIKEVLGCGVEYVILGTTAISKPDFVKKTVKKFGKRIMVSIDASNLKVRVQGWEKKTRKTAPVLAREMVKLGVRNIIFTDIRRDGTLKGPNISQIEKMLQEQMRWALSTIPEREAKILRLRFGLDNGYSRTLKEVGAIFNVTGERIRQIEAQALRMLRQPLMRFPQPEKIILQALIVSGGISSLEDIKKLKPLEKKGLSGVIVGKALYTGRIDLEEALEIGESGKVRK